MTDDNKKRRGRGEGGIRFRDDLGLWEARASVTVVRDGKKVRERPTATGETKRQALENLKRLRDEIDVSGARFADRKTPLRDFLAAWLDRCKTTKAPNTFLQYEQHCRRYLTPILGGVPVGKIDVAKIGGLFAELQKQGVSRKLQRKIGITLSAALGAAVKDGILANNPYVLVEKPKADDAERPKAYDKGQIARLLAAAADDRLFALYVLGLDSGMRQEELFALAWQDLDLGSRTVRIDKALEEVSRAKRALIGDAGQQDKFRIKSVKTRLGRRTITLAPETVEVLRRHRARMDDEGHGGTLVFPDTRGGFLCKANVRNRSLIPVLQRGALPNYGLHALRHTCATLLLLDGVSVKIVSHRLGHSTARQTLDTYAHLLPDSQDVAARSTSGFLGPALKPRDVPTAAH